MKSYKNYIKKTIPILISLVLLFVVFRNIDFAQLIKALFSINLNVIIVSIVLILMGLFFKFKRWKVLLLVLKKDIKGINIFSSMVIGVLGDHVLPAKAGEFIRSYLVGTKENISKVSVFGTVIIERVMDIFSILVICGIALIFISVKQQVVLQAEIAGISILLIVAFSIFLFIKQKGFLTKIISRLLPSRYSNRIVQIFDLLSNGLRIIKEVRQFLIVFFWSLSMWFFIIGSFIPILYAFNYGGVNPPLYTIFVLLLFVTFGLSIPSSPGGIGIYEYASFLTLQICLPLNQMEFTNINAEVGAFAILLHFTQVVPELLLGFYFFMREGLKWSFLSNMKRLEGKQGD